MDTLLYITIFFFGLFFGSFANVVILRLHEEEKGILSGKSYCPKCKHNLGFWDLFPVFSWVFLGGKCRYCKNPISWQYPLVELLMGLLWVFLIYFSGITFESLFQNTENIIQFFYLLLFGFFFLVMFVADLRFYEVFRYITIPLLIITTLMLPFGFTPDWQSALLGVVILAGFFILQILISRYIITSRGDWVGEGDIDFAVLMGLILGWKVGLISLFLAYFIGAIAGVSLMVVKGKDAQQIPFGPFLLLSLLICMFWGQDILDFYVEGVLGFESS